MKISMNFKTEKEMSCYFKDFLIEVFNEENIEILEELKGLFGIPDFVFIEKNNQYINHIIAIELKLKNWKKALIQAFKYRNFANQSYVIIDEKNLSNAVKNIDNFKQSNIGLASFNKNKELRIHFYPNSNDPFSVYYKEKLINSIFTLENKSNFIEKFKLDFTKANNLLPLKFENFCL